MWNSRKKIFLAELITDPLQKEIIDQRMEELEQLVSTLGGMTVVQIIQQRAKPDYTSYLGKGKLEEIVAGMKATWAGLLIIWNILKARQIYHINELLRKEWLEARDRVDLILNIFDHHATSTEARLQIELAAIKHMWPRIFGMGLELSRQGWGSKLARGVGETNTEIMRRHLATRKKQIEKELLKYEQVRATHRQSRSRQGMPTVGLVWYTNAGKSSIMNALTHKGVLVENKLFATLGTDVGELYYPSLSWKWSTVLINDTIGFIRDLPPSLIQAFTSTLEDSVMSDLLLHVVDANDPVVYDKIQVVDEILDQIWAKQKRVLVFNKMDQIDKAKHIALVWAYRDEDPVFVSAYSGQGMEHLRERIAREVGVEVFE